MKLSTKGRYAVTAMLDLAINDGNRPVTLAEISRSQGISLSYLEQLFAKLRARKLVEGVRGPGGGYRLAKPAERISVADIVRAVEQSLDARRNRGDRDSQDGELAQELWNDLSERLEKFLEGITLADYSRRPDVRERVKAAQKAAAAQDVRHAFLYRRDAA